MNTSKQDYIIRGDINVDFFKNNFNSKISEHLNAISAEGCNNLINKPTSITENTVTLLDHIYSNITNSI